MAGYNITQRDEGESGEVVGWAKVDPASMRFGSFVSPRTNQRISGLCVRLQGEDNESWINKAGRWERMQFWMKNAYIKKLESESDDEALPFVGGATESAEVVNAL